MFAPEVHLVYSDRRSGARGFREGSGQSAFLRIQFCPHRLICFFHRFPAPGDRLGNRGTGSFFHEIARSEPGRFWPVYITNTVWSSASLERGRFLRRTTPIVKKERLWPRILLRTQMLLRPTSQQKLPADSRRPRKFFWLPNHELGRIYLKA